MKKILILIALFILLVRPVAAVQVPRFLLHDVPFTSQAPFGDWRLPYQEACEEATVIMANAWVKGQKLSKQSGNAEIKKLVAFETKHYGNYKDTDAKETAQFAKEFYGLNTIVRYDIDHNDIHAELAKGNLVIAPMAGQLLKNPYFTQPGPIYHMILFIGYDDTKQQFIVNDPGTRRGTQFRYSYKTIDAALHDWSGSPETILKGRRAMIVIKK